MLNSEVEEGRGGGGGGGGVGGEGGGGVEGEGRGGGGGEGGGRGGIAYICGDIKVGTAVRDAFMKLARVHGRMGVVHANVCRRERRRERERGRRRGTN